MRNDAKWETIIQLGAEGGSIELLGMQNEKGEWSFRRRIHEIPFYDLDSERIERAYVSKGERTFKSTHFSYEAETFEDALKLLDDYPWLQLNPRSIHPLFSNRVWKEVCDKGLDNKKLRRWAKACFPKLMRLVQFMKASSHTVILTGAGMSTESGVPDFRSKSGWWKNIDPRSVATVEALEGNYDLFHEFYSMRLRALTECVPHKGHDLLANWQKQGLVQIIATQNVDHFHQLAGASDVQALHGSIRSFRCHYCGAAAKESTFLLKEPCTNCGGKTRPEVVLFGEVLPETTWQNVLQHIYKADLVIVIGTSLEVYPVNQLPDMTNGHTVLLNLDEIQGTYDFDLMIKGKVKDILERVDELLKIM